MKTVSRETGQEHCLVILYMQLNGNWKFQIYEVPEIFCGSDKISKICRVEPLQI